MNMTQTPPKRRGPSPKGKRAFVKTSIMVDPDSLEWAKGQPEGLSGMVRECIRRNYEARSAAPAERLAQTRTEG